MNSEASGRPSADTDRGFHFYLWTLRHINSDLVEYLRTWIGIHYFRTIGRYLPSTIYLTVSRYDTYYNLCLHEIVSRGVSGGLRRLLSPPVMS